MAEATERALKCLKVWVDVAVGSWGLGRECRFENETAPDHMAVQGLLKGHRGAGDAIA